MSGRSLIGLSRQFDKLRARFGNAGIKRVLLAKFVRGTCVGGSGGEHEGGLSGAAVLRTARRHGSPAFLGHASSMPRLSASSAQTILAAFSCSSSTCGASPRRRFPESPAFLQPNARTAHCEVAPASGSISMAKTLLQRNFPSSPSGFDLAGAGSLPVFAAWLIPHHLVTLNFAKRMLYKC